MTFDSEASFKMLARVVDECRSLSDLTITYQKNKDTVIVVLKAGESIDVIIKYNKKVLHT